MKSDAMFEQLGYEKCAVEQGELVHYHRHKDGDIADTDIRILIEGYVSCTMGAFPCGIAKEELLACAAYLMEETK